MTRLLYLSADPGVPVLGHKGASVHLRELVDALVALGATVIVASPRIAPEGDRFASEVELVEIDPILPKAYRTQEAIEDAMRRQADQIEEVARSLGVDGVYERFSLFSDGGVRAATALDVPHVLEVNAPLRDEARRFRVLPHAAIAATVERRVLAATDRVFVVSDELRSALARVGLDPRQIEVAPNGVDPAKFPPVARPPRATFAAGFCGSLKPWHGVDVLLEAVRLALAAEDRLRFEVVGTGPLAEAVEAAALPPDRFVAHGPLPHREALRVVATWDAGIAPFVAVPDFYFSPLKVVEYMAAGLATVASDLGQIRSLLGEGERGVLVPPGDAPALAAALVALARNPEQARRLGERAHAYACMTRTWSRNAERVLDAMRSHARIGVA